MPVLKGGLRSNDPATFWEHEGNRAMRKGNWKLVASHGKPWELYDLAADRAEQNNRIQTHSHRAAQMQRAWSEWAARCNVLPWDQVRAAPSRTV